MATVLDSPVLRFVRKRRHFTILNEAKTAVMATAVPIIGGEGKGRLGRMFSNGSFEQIVIQVLDPGGIPLFSVERPSCITPATQPVTIRGRGDEVLGHIIEGDEVIQDTSFGGKSVIARQKIIDVRRDTTVEIAWKPIRLSNANRPPSGYCDYFGTDGTNLGRFEDNTLRLSDSSSGPLRSLVIASPIAFIIRYPYSSS